MQGNELKRADIFVCAPDCDCRVCVYVCMCVYVCVYVCVFVYVSESVYVFVWCCTGRIQFKYWNCPTFPLKFQVFYDKNWNFLNDKLVKTLI